MSSLAVRRIRTEPRRRRGKTIFQRHFARRFKCADESEPAAAATPELPPCLAVFRRFDQQTTRKILHERAQQEVDARHSSYSPEIDLNGSALGLRPGLPSRRPILIDHQRDGVHVERRAYQRNRQRCRRRGLCSGLRQRHSIKGLLPLGTKVARMGMRLHVLIPLAFTIFLTIDEDVGYLVSRQLSQDIRIAQRQTEPQCRVMRRKITTVSVDERPMMRHLPVHRGDVGIRVTEWQLDHRAARTCGAVERGKRPRSFEQEASRSSMCPPTLRS